MLQRLWYHIKFPVYIQRSSSDCGIECLRMILAYYKLPHSHPLVAKFLSFDIYGTNFKSMQEASQNLGLDCLAVKLSLQELMQTAPLPCILHWQNDHFVVLYKLNQQFAWIVDPAKGIRKIEIQELVTNCLTNNNVQEPKGMVLLFEKKEFFKPDTVAETKPSFLNHVLHNKRVISVCIIISICLAFILAQFQLIISFKRHAIDHFKTEFLFSTLWLLFLGYYVLKQLRKSKDVDADLEGCFSTDLSLFPKEIRQDYIYDSVDCFYKLKYHNQHWTYFWLSVSCVLGVGIYSLHSSFYLSGLCLGLLLFYGVVKVFVLKYMDKSNSGSINEASMLQSDLNKYFEELMEIEHSGKQLDNKHELKSIIQNADIKLSAKPQYYLLNGIFILSFIILLILIGERKITTAQAIIGSFSLFSACISLDMIIRYCWNYASIRKPKKPDSNINHDIIKQNDQALVKNTSFNLILENVNYAYPSENWSASLNGINLSIPERSKVLIMGRPGSGKSTLIKLLAKEATEYSGKILIGEEDIQNLNRRQLAYYLGLINDDSKILPGSLAWNISLEKEFDTKKINEVVNALFLESYINNLPEGLETNLLSTDIYLPPGIVKRILLARLLYLNKSVNLIDLEDFNINSIQNLIMFESLFDIAKDKTIILVSSDVELAKSADMIMIMEDGEIIEQGNYHELSEKQGVFSSFVMQHKLIN
ncbi:MAG TPA: cysteine peptidase family C39 domain-containing protein [Saprospiraceae bacterium]|nr:cysteine peptidase family C39 domain-containing protein [Saprospiraceae bacterium]